MDETSRSALYLHDRIDGRGNSGYINGAIVLEPLQSRHGGLLALVEVLHHRYSPRVALISARLVCAPLTLEESRAPLSIAGQWREWLSAKGLACVCEPGAAAEYASSHLPSETISCDHLKHPT